MTKEEYQAYLKSPRWKVISYWKKRQQPVCEMCGSKVKLEVHHKTYENVGHEKPEDLFVLCRWCHELTHQKENPTNGVELLIAYLLQKKRYRW